MFSSQSNTHDMEMGERVKRVESETTLVENTKKEETEETEYQPVNWKKLLLSPKYLRTI
jgi:hypothetical protein